jgi:histone H3/H4
MAKTPKPKTSVATVPVQFRLEESQIKALRAAAFERAIQRGSARPDVSEIAREAIDEWIARHPARPVLPR